MKHPHTIIGDAAEAAGLDRESLQRDHKPPVKQRGAKYWAAFLYELRKTVDESLMDGYVSWHRALWVELPIGCDMLTVALRSVAD